MSKESKTFYEFGPFRLDVVERQLWRGEEEIPLTQKSFGVLLVLLKNYGHLVKKEVFLRQVWPGVNVEEKNLTDNISILRKALGDHPKKSIYIKTVPRQGYRFAGDVTVSGENVEEVVVTEHTRAHIIIEEEQEEISPLSQAAPLTQSHGQQELTAAPHTALPRRITRPAMLAVGLMLALGGTLFWQRYRAESSAVPRPLTRALKTVPLTTFPDEEMESALSPDGKFVAFAWKGGTSDRINIYVQQVDAGSPQRLTTALAREGRPTWSPDGRYIAFVRGSMENGKSGIYVIPAFGGHERQLLAGVIVGLDWSVDGKHLVFALRNPVQEPFGINILTVDSLEVRRLTTPPAGTFGDIHPVFSPDNQTLAFIRYSDDTGELFLMPASGGGDARQLTFDNRRIDGLVWTPDGQQLIFSSNRGGSYNLWSIPAQGGAPSRVEGVGNDAHDPSISRLGNRLTYGYQVVDTNIWRVPLRGGLTNSEPPVKVVASTHRDENPRLSPDGQKIAFQSNRSGALEVWVCDSDGSNQVELTSFNGPVTGNARWSPDGRQIAFDSRPEGHADIFVVNAGGGPLRRMTTGQGDNLAPSWSHDGRWIYFGSNRSGSWQVWKIPAEGGEAVQVTQRGGYEAIEAPDGQSIYYNKYGLNTVGIFRLSLAGGEETMVIDLPQLDSFGDWVVTNEGLYFIHRYDAVGKRAANPSIDFFNFATRRTITVMLLKQDPTSNPGLNISPDGRWLLYSNDDYRSLDIMLVENFLASVNNE